MQSFFSFSPRISQGCNASRQSSDILSGRCQLTGKDFTSLALLLSGLLLLGGRSLGIFRGSVRSICGRFASFDLLARGCELTDEGIASLALLFSGLLLLGGRSLSSLQSFFSFSPRIGQGCNASRQSSDILSGRCQLTGKDFTSLALLLSGLLLLGGRQLNFSAAALRSICGRFASFDLLARGCELTDEGFTSLALLFQRPASARRPKPGQFAKLFQLQSAHRSGL